MTYEEYLKDKKIDSTAFKNSEPIRWEELNYEFEKSGSLSFTLNKKFLINLIRRKYLLKESVAVPAPTQVSAAAPARKKPVMR